MRFGRVVEVILPYQRAIAGDLFGFHDESVYALLRRHAVDVQQSGQALEREDLGTHSQCIRC